MFGVAVIIGCMIIYCFLMILATSAFWLIRVSNILIIFDTLYGAARWPIDLYPGWLRMLMTFVIPVAIAITVPVKALLGKRDVQHLAQSIVLTAVLFLVSRLFWKYGVRQYSGASP